MARSNNMHFSVKLRRLIEEKGITQKQLANELHMPVSTLGGYVQGTSEPDFATLKIIADYFNVSSDYLLGIKSKTISSQSESELLRVFRTLESDAQQLYIEIGKAMLKHKHKHIK